MFSLPADARQSRAPCLEQVFHVQDLPSNAATQTVLCKVLRELPSAGQSPGDGVWAA